MFSQLHKGLSKNFSPIAQPTDSVSFVLNGVQSSFKGEQYQIQSEPGNNICLTLPEGYKTLGSGYGTDNELYIFSTDGTSSEIGILKDCKYTLLVNADFGFDIRKPIMATFRIKNGCERNIYWVDGLNEDRFFNVDRPELFKDEFGNWDINKFKLVPNVLIPEIDLVSVNDSGGLLPLGGYYFQIEILDEGLNVVYKSYITPETVIYDDAINEAYNQIDGGLNILNNTPEIGGVPVTNKSISLQFSNIDTSFRYIRVIAIRAITGDGFTVDAHTVGQLLSITGDTINFTYQGFNPGAGDALLDYSSTLIPTFSYNSSEVITQVQNRLVRANVKLKDRDYTGYQRIVNDITTTCVTKTIDKRDAQISGNPKNPNTYWENLSHMQDEVYAKGIVFAYDDGTLSPVFHIPGREATTLDRQLLTVVNEGLVTDPTTEVDIREVRHLNLMINDSVENWKVFNTATPISSNEYNMSFYEIETLYPDTVDCIGQPIYGDLVGTPIRHHKFPDRRLIEVDNGSPDFTILGLKFDNIVFPDSDIIGYYIVNVKRDNFNKTVLDTGVLYPARDVEDGFIGNRRWFDGLGINNKAYAVGMNTYQSLPLTQSKNWTFFSPKTQFNKEYLNGTYFTLLRDYRYSNMITEITSYPDNFDIDSQSITLKQELVPEITNRTYEGNIYVNSYSTQSPTGVFPTSIVNSSHSNDLNFYRMIDTIDIPQEEEWYFYYTANKRVNFNCYSSLSNLIYYHGSDIQTGTVTDDLYNGDIFISELGYYDMVRYPFDLKDGEVNFAYDLWMESEINVALRHEGTDECNKYYHTDVNTTGLNDYSRDRIATLISGTYEQRIPACKEFYGYNKDYSRLSQDTFYVPLPLTYNYCGQCRNLRTTRIIYSPQSFDEELSDGYRITLSEDYIDISANKGQILGLRFKRNQLIVNCEEGSFVLQPNPQQIATDQNLAYLTTGDFLAIPAQEIIQSDVGYGGLQDKLATINTRYGYTWVDAINGKINEFGDGIKDINGELDYWLNENLPFKINETIYNAFGTKLNYKSVIAGLGIQLAFDPLRSRLIVHKTDYDLTKNAKLIFTGTVESDADFTFGLQVNINTGKWRVTGLGTYNDVDITNKEYFINKSWTLSYGYETQSWVSWHSYQPQFMMYDTHSLYTSVDNGIWKHLDDGNYQTFYGKKYDYIVEWVNSNPVTQNVNTVHYHGQTLSLDADSDQWVETRNRTFDRMLVYNQYHSTGLQNLNLILQDISPYGNLGYSGTTKNVVRTDKNYKIGQVYDMSTQQPVVSSDWTLIQSEYDNGQGYIDIVSNDVNIEYTRPQRNLRQLKDKWTKTRLYFKPEEDLKKILYFTSTNTENSIR